MTGKQAYVFADGGSRGNPGPSGAGALVREGDPRGPVVAEMAEFLGTTTNNVAEYTGLIIGLKKAIELGYSDIEARMDSELVVKQIKGEYRVKNEKLKPLYMEAKLLVSRIENFSIVHIARELNKDADRLANQAMDSAQSLQS
ncbi:MAG: ribonuclease HI family protein [Candidatus Obscuribacterales bacterium]